MTHAAWDGTDLDDAPAHEGAVANSQLPLPMHQHAHSLPPCQSEGLLGQGGRVAVLSAPNTSLEDSTHEEK